MSGSGSDAADASTETKRDLADRIARFSRALFVLSATMFVVSMVLELGSQTTPESKSLLHPSRVFHLIATLIALVAWRGCRRSTLRVKTLEAIDATVTISLSACWALLAVGVSRREPIEFSMALALAYTLIARSVMIPSSFTRTLWISGISIIPSVIVMSIRQMGFITNAPPEQVRAFLIFSTLWSVIAALTAAANSRQLYGLRAQIREIGKLGQYTLESKLGEGGMGIVYRASHAMLRRPAAIKLLPPDRAGARDLARFEREVQLTSQLAHPNTVSIFDYGRTAAGVFYYVMEYLDGLDLDQLVEENGPLDPPRAIHILAQASGALSEAHALGLIHRDIKPANIMLTERPDQPDVVKVVDFGLVKTIDSEANDVLVSNANVITGTPMYLAPEAISSPDDIDARSDLYALGAVGYFLLTGHQVFAGRTIVEICGKHLNVAPVNPSIRLGKPLPADLEALVLACLAKRPEDRPASAAILREALLACVDAASYDSHASRAWWTRHREKPRDGARKSRSLGSAATMAIDLRGRHTDA